jgi:hypothetical protein
MQETPLTDFLYEGDDYCNQGHKALLVCRRGTRGSVDLHQMLKVPTAFIVVLP